jgi:hypothetical protein
MVNRRSLCTLHIYQPSNGQGHSQKNETDLAQKERTSGTFCAEKTTSEETDAETHEAQKDGRETNSVTVSRIS